MSRNSNIITRTASGFTLVEMMVALLIFGMLSLAGVMMLQTAVATNDITDGKISGMAAMQRFVSLMEADLSQAIPRTYRDEAGAVQPAFSSDGTAQLLNFTRNGQSNLNDRPISALRVVSYQVEGDELQRVSTDMTDGGTPGNPAVLLENISAVSMRYRGRLGIWSDNWQTEKMADMPRAVEINFTHDGRGYRHVFLVGTGYL